MKHLLQTTDTQRTISTFWSKNCSIFLFVMVLFLIGVIFGTLVFNGTSVEQRSELGDYINGYLSNDSNVSSADIFASSFIQNMQLALTIWILGITVVGAPLSLLILFGNGALIGFTIGFLVNQGGWSGFLLVCEAVLPQNILLIPTILLLTSCSLIFSKHIISRLLKNNTIPIIKQMKWYISILLICITLLTLSSVIEAYLCTFLIKITS